MGYRLGCPGCDGWTSEIFRAYGEGLPCPYCGTSLATPENAKHYSEQLPKPKAEPEWRSPTPLSVIADAIEGSITVSLNERASLALAQEILDGLEAASLGVDPR